MTNISLNKREQGVAPKTVSNMKNINFHSGTYAKWRVRPPIDDIATESSRRTSATSIYSNADVTLYSYICTLDSLFENAYVVGLI